KSRSSDSLLAKFPLLDRRGGCAIKKMAPFLSGADGVVDQIPKSNKERCAGINLSTTPLASYLGSLPLLSRRGNLAFRANLLAVEFQLSTEQCVVTLCCIQQT